MAVYYYICQVPFCMFMDLNSVSQKKNEAIICSRLDQTSLVNKGFIINKAFREIFIAGHGRQSQGRQDNAILPGQVANHNAGFGSACPLTELAIL